MNKFEQRKWYCNVTPIPFIQSLYFGCKGCSTLQHADQVSEHIFEQAKLDFVQKVNREYLEEVKCDT